MQRSTVPILHLDDQIVAVSKPSGLLVHRTPDARDRSFLLQKVRDQVGDYLYPVHRIDRAASGIVLFGRTPEDARLLQAALGDEAAAKEYRVLARGSPPDEFASERPLTDDGGERKACSSRFRVEERFARSALLSVRITTGRRHQIRRHLAHLAHHVIGDTSYGKGRINREYRERYGLNRLFLHAERLSICRTDGTRWLDLHDPIPAELSWVLDRLREDDGEVRPPEV